MGFEDLKNPELQEKLRSAKSVDELVELAKAEGIELSDTMLEAMSGGSNWYHRCTEDSDFVQCETKAFCATNY